MKKILIGVILVLLSIFTSCQQTKSKKINKNDAKETKIIFLIQKEKISKKNIPVDLLNKNKNFNNLINNFNNDKYSVEQLKDKTKQNLKYIHTLTFKTKKSVLDSTALKSRFVLTEIELKRLNFLLNQKNINIDTIEKTVNQVVIDLNKIINLIAVYKDNTDEFEEILSIDSIETNTDKSNKSVTDKTKISKTIKNIHIK